MPNVGPSIWQRHPSLFDFAADLRRRGKKGHEIAEKASAKFGEKITAAVVDSKLNRAGVKPQFAGEETMAALTEPTDGYARDVVAVPTFQYQKGWEPRVEELGDTAVAISPVVETPNPDIEWLIRGWGLDPAHWRIVGPLGVNRWQTPVPVAGGVACTCEPRLDVPHHEGKWNHQYKAKLERIDPIREQQVEDLLEEIRTHVPVPFAVPRGDDATVICIADPQMGKGDQGGSPRAVANFLRSMDAFEERVRWLRMGGKSMGPLYVLGMGDLIEQCLAGETEVVTRTGIRTLRDLAAEGKAVLKTEYGAWVESEVRSYGVQRLMRIELSRGRARKVIFATAGHRWFRMERPGANSAKEEAVTAELRVGDMLVSNFGKHPGSMSPVGVMAGYVFGDGHRNSGDPQHGCAVNVHRNDFGLLPYFDGHPRTEVRKHSETKLTMTDASDYVKVSGLPAFFKAVPDLNESLPYLYGWAAGYFAADGSVSKTVSISSARREHLEIFASICARLGIGANPITVHMRKGCGEVETALYKLSLVAATVPAEFFVHPAKREAFEQLRASVTQDDSTYTWQKNRSKYWRVESVEWTDRTEEVFCAVVPETHSFTLANDLLTGNCGGFYPQQAFRADQNRRNQIKIMRRLIVQALARWAPLFERVVVAAVPGNHGENRTDGKSFTDFADNDDLSIFEVVQEILEANPATYGHVSFKIPDAEPWLTLDMGGEIVGLTHGHVVKMARASASKKHPEASSIAKRALDWWAQMAHGQQSIGGARILFTAHYHHLLVTAAGSKTHFQCPALESGSDWYRYLSGQASSSGMLTVRIGKNVAESGWDDLAVV